MCVCVCRREKGYEEKRVSVKGDRGCEGGRSGLLTCMIMMK